MFVFAGEGKGLNSNENLTDAEKKFLVQKTNILSSHPMSLRSRKKYEVSEEFVTMILYALTQYQKHGPRYVVVCHHFQGKDTQA